MEGDEDIFEIDDEIELIDIVENNFPFPRRIYMRADHFNNMDDLTFFRRFRLTKPTVLRLLEQIEDELEFHHNLNDSVSPINQLLTCLRFYASSGHLASIADFMGMHISSASRIIRRVSVAIARLRNVYITMPEGQEVVDTQTEFHQIAAFPRVLGCIDGTHIRIQSPGGEDGEVFRNRKSYFSINTQVVCDARLRVRDIVARWPGATHDATIYANSRIRARFEANEFPNCLILGDSGYPSKNYFLIPHPNPVTEPERLYNESHIRTRNTIERLFGVLKRRFPVLAYGLRLKLQTNLVVIVATAILHNIAINMNEEQPPAPENINLEELNNLIQMEQIPPLLNNDMGNFNYRDELIDQYFGNL